MTVPIDVFYNSSIKSLGCCGYLHTPHGMRSVEKSLPNEESIYGRVKAEPSVDKCVAKDGEKIPKRGGEKVMDRHGCTSTTVF